ncbi:MAG: FHA domain-containing protein [Candidatus Eremiobacterota bacterium]
MKCPVCGVDNLEGSAYCDDCGSKLPAAGAAPVAASQPVAPPPVAVTPTPVVGGKLTCQACSFENNLGEAFCSDCGASLSGASPVEPVIPSPVVSGQPSPPVTPVVPGRPVAKLIEKKTQREFPLTADVMIAGRQSPADNIFPDLDLTEVDTDSYVSRRHLQIIRQGEQYLVEDLGSSNGTFLNEGPRLNPGIQQSLSNGDRIQLGQTEFVFVIS